MYSETDVARFLGPPTFDRASAYQQQGRVSDTRWSDDRRILTGHVRGSGRTPYSSRVRLRVGDRGLEPVVGVCDCPVGDRCKHVGALLLEAVRADADPRPADGGWRRTLDPILDSPDLHTAGATLGLQFELQPANLSRAPGRFARTPPKSAEYSVAVRPVQLGAKGRWRRTGVSWRDVAFAYSSHNWDDQQLEPLRELHRLLTDPSSLYSTDSWVRLDRAHSASLWSVLDAARHAGVGMITGGASQRAIEIATAVAVPAVDVARTEDGLVLRPLIASGDADSGHPIPRPLSVIGEPAVGVATWSRPDESAQLSETVVTLLRFAEPVAPAARAFLRLEDPIRIPADEERVFLGEHYRRLAALLPIVSRDGSFVPPTPPVTTLVLHVEHATGARLTGTWGWRYAPREHPDAAMRFPLDSDRGAAVRDARAERRIRDAVAAAGIGPVTTPALADPITGRLLEQWSLSGMAAVEVGRELLETLRAVPDVEIEERGTAVDYRAAEQPPVVSVGTSERSGDRDWFDLEIEVRVGDETVPLADVIRALARGDEVLVAPSGVYFPLDDPVFTRLRDLIAEARELTDQPADALRISRFQSSLWDDLAELGIVTRQAEAWRRSAAALMGFTASGALERQDLPAGFRVELRPYQQDGYDWLAFLYDNGLGGVLADDMGLGKTVQSLALVARAVDRARDADAPSPRFLVVAPTSVVPNWVAEAHRFAPALKVVEIDRTTRKSGVALRKTVGDADLVVTSYALYRLDEDAYAQLGWAGLLLDEAQFVKNRHAATHAAVRALDVPFKLAITGTPMENTLMDLWSILSIVAPGLFPSPTGFAEYYQRPIEREGDAERLAQLRRRIRPLMLRRTKELVASELPPKLEQVLEVELGEQQRAVYDRYLARERQRVLGLIGDFDRNRFAIFRALTMLRQAALDASLVDPDAADVPSAKLDLLDELLTDALDEGHRVLVFSQFTRLLARVRTRLDAAGIEYAYLDGATTKRGAAIETFRGGSVNVFLISLKAGGFGLNLAEADYCVLLDPWWNPAAEEQAVDRAHRIGQNRPVHVYRLVAKDTIEQKVMALKQTKADLFDAVMGETEAVASKGITADDVRELLG